MSSGGPAGTSSPGLRHHLTEAVPLPSVCSCLRRRFRLQDGVGSGVAWDARTGGGRWRGAGMAQNPKLVPAEYPEHIQKFLFACAFWIVAADEQLTQGEQRWLIEQFGQRKAASWLDEMTSMQGTQFYQVFDKLAAALGDNDKRRVYPLLVTWLHACGSSDMAGAAAEAEIVGKIRARLSLDAQIARLVRAPVKHVPPTPEQVAPLPPAKPAIPIPVRTSAPEPKPQPELEHPRAVSVPFRTFRGHRGAVWCACFDHRGAGAFSGSEDKTLRAWDVPAGVETRTFAEQEAAVSAVACSSDGAYVFSGSTDGTVTRWRSGNGGRTWQVVLDGADAITAIAAGGDGALVAAASESGLVTVMKAEDGQVVKTLGQGGNPMRDVRMGRAGKLLLCGGDERVLKLWDAAGDTWTSIATGHTGAVLAVGMRPDAKVAATGSADKTIKLWDLGSGKELRSLAGHAAAVHGLDFSPDGLLLASASEDGTVRLWEAATGRQVFAHPVSEQALWGVAFHPAGAGVLVCGSDQNVYHLENIVPAPAAG